ncbi:MAG TPA: FAD-dependent oxidoreductase [Anaerolineales bacterium]|nr:FAD-dependent oxidoreductase [Anaerolineae bacterium]HIP87345.1 FAD-dependent oxidoreductase [Anaerolineales bacterium]
MYDLIVIGGGPAGITAAAIAINQRLETLIIAERWGGQTTYEMQLEDMEGQEIITGESLLEAFRRQLDYLDFARRFDRVVKVTPGEDRFVVETGRGDRFEGQALIIATGAKPQRLDVPGEDRLAGRGLSYSAATHAGLFLGKDVAVVGNGRRAQWAAASLARKAHRVYLLAQEPLVPTPLAARLRRMENVDVVEGATVREVLGESFVEGIRVAMPDGAEREIPVKGVFVKLARTPNSELVREWIDCDDRGHIIVDVHCATSWPGVFAAGDVTLVSEQVLVHIGEGAKAALSAYHYLLMR